MNPGTRGLCWVVLFMTLGLAMPARSQAKPQRHWRGMEPVNNKYDWLRPPVPILEMAVSRVHSGITSSNNFRYEYKKEIRFDAVNYVFGLFLSTPTSSAANVAQSARRDFDKKALAEAMTQFHDSFYLSVNFEAFQRDDMPNLAILIGGTVMRPSRLSAIIATPANCMGWNGLPCWYNQRDYEFLLPPTQRLSGPASIVLRWNSAEKIVPIDFDYVW